MADDSLTPKFDTEGLTALAMRLAAHADATLVNKAAERDFRLASQACDRLVYLRLTVAGIAQKAIENPTWNNASLARDLCAALDRVEQGSMEGDS